jgi:hypothetical protein
MDSTKSHIPGPWHLDPSGRANCLGTFTIFFGPGESAGNQIGCAPDLQTARLIAAAPDLLSACKALLDAFHFGGGERQSKALSDVEAAARKAEGRQ